VLHWKDTFFLFFFGFYLSLCLNWKVLLWRLSWWILFVAEHICGGNCLQQNLLATEFACGRICLGQKFLVAEIAGGGNCLRRKLSATEIICGGIVGAVKNCGGN
jgi:hypothetical protein